jgi:hypothetical protein
MHCISTSCSSCDCAKMSEREMSDGNIIITNVNLNSSTGISPELNNMNIDDNREEYIDKSISMEAEDYLLEIPTEEQQNMIVTEYKTLLDGSGIAAASEFILKRCIENLDPALQQVWNRIADETLQYLSSTTGESYSYFIVMLLAGVVNLTILLVYE